MTEIIYNTRRIESEKCDNCEGTGQIIEEVWRAVCLHCDGTGRVRANAPTITAQTPTTGATAFATLSKDAQDLIVRAFLGEFDESPPPEIPESVKAEIADWASKDEEENKTSYASPLLCPQGSQKRI